MSAKRVIPITDIMSRYKDLRAKNPQVDRLREAEHLVEHPEELAAEFAASVTHFAAYKNVEDHFYPPGRPKREPASGAQKRTNDWVLPLQDQGSLVPVDGSDRLVDHDAGPGLRAVPAAQLACDYVDRELLVQRTTSPAAWEDGKPNRGGLRLDVLLADAADRTPIVGELKLPGDMDPFFALIQALACAAHLATPHQYERMRRHLDRGKFPELSAAPRLDIWVLFVDPPNDEVGPRRKPQYMGHLKAAAEALAPKLLAQDGISASLRRVAGLSLKRDDRGQVAADVLWAWERSSA